MRRQKSNIFAWHRLGFAAILLAACVLVSTGVVLARYQTEISGNPVYAAKKTACVYLWSGADESGIFLDEESKWQTDDGVRTLDFCVSNGSNNEDCAENTQKVYIRLIATLGLLNTETLEVSLTLSEEALDTANAMIHTYQGTAQRIVQGSPMYESFGDGWVFTFEDEDGNELSWPLEGGTLSVLYAQLSVANAEVQEASMLKLQVVGDLSNR